MEKIWLKHYPAGVPDTIDPDHYASLLDILEESIEKYGEKTAFVNMDCEMSFAELGEKAKQFAAYLQSIGLKKGDAVAIMMPNLFFSVIFAKLTGEISIIYKDISQPYTE